MSSNRPAGSSKQRTITMKIGSIPSSNLNIGHRATNNFNRGSRGYRSRRVPNQFRSDFRSYSQPLIDLTTDTAPTSLFVPPLVPQNAQNEEDDDDNLTASSSLSPINSPKKRANRSKAQSQSEECLNRSNFVSNFKMNHKVDQQAKPRKHRYNLRTNATETGSVFGSGRIENLSDDCSSYSFSSKSSTDSCSNWSPLCVSINFGSANKPKIPCKMVQNGKCPIFGCGVKQKFKNEAMMRRHIGNLHAAQTHFFCKLCRETLFCSKSDFLRIHQNGVHSNKKETDLLLATFAKETKRKISAHLAASAQLKCLFHAKCQNDKLFGADSMASHYEKWHLMNAENARNIVNIQLYEAGNRFVDSQFMRKWHSLMADIDRMSPSQAAAKHYNASKVQTNYGFADSFIPSREQCRKALQSAILIDELHKNKCDGSELSAIEKVTDLILFGCKNDRATLQTMRDLDCIAVDHQSEAKMKNESALRAFAQCIDQRYLQHIQNAK